MTEALLRTEGLTKHFKIGSALSRRTLHAVDNVQLTIGEREIVALAGESGSGKSTIARLLAKLYQPTREEEQLAAAIRAGGWSQTTEVVNDTFAVLRAGLVDGEPVPWGVGVTCGAGINCVAVAPDGRTTRYLALGWISGDWGGGYGLGKAALWRAIRAEDGRGPDTALRAAVPAHFGVRTVHDVAVGIHQGTIGQHDLLGLAPVLLAAAAGGDQVAADLVGKQAREIATMALTAMRRLGLLELATPVVLGGGLMTARDPLLTGWIAEAIAAEAPAATIGIVDVPPIAGAALLGLDHVGACPAAEQRLRAVYAAPERATDTRS